MPRCTLLAYCNPRLTVGTNRYTLPLSVMLVGDMNKQLVVLAGALAMGAYSAPAKAQREVHELPEIGVEGRVDRPDRPEPGGRGGEGRGGDGRGRGSGSSTSSGTSTTTMTMPTIFISYDTGTPPLPPQGFQSHVVRYSDGSYDLVSVSGPHYSITRYGSGGTPYNTENGYVRDYPKTQQSIDRYRSDGGRFESAGRGPAGMPSGDTWNYDFGMEPRQPEFRSYQPPMPPPVWTCYTSIGPIRVNNVMPAGQPCFAILPQGTFNGTAGYP
jgi:hypothetical protein